MINRASAADQTERPTLCAQKEDQMKSKGWIVLGVTTVCLGCAPAGIPPKKQAQTPALIPNEQALLWSVSENGKYEAKIDKYDPVERIAHVIRPEPPLTAPLAKQSRLAHEFANGTSLPYQYDGTNWVPLWSPSRPPDLELRRIEGTQPTAGGDGKPAPQP